MASIKKLREVSLYVDDLVNLPHNQRMPFVGKSAFAHKGGPHVNAVKKNPVTFEHIDPAEVGNERHILVSELSGGSNVLEYVYFKNSSPYSTLTYSLEGDIEALVHGPGQERQ